MMKIIVRRFVGYDYGEILPIISENPDDEHLGEVASLSPRNPENRKGLSIAETEVNEGEGML